MSSPIQRGGKGEAKTEEEDPSELTCIPRPLTKPMPMHLTHTSRAADTPRDTSTERIQRATGQGQYDIQDSHAYAGRVLLTRVRGEAGWADKIGL
jgi:hypothetical protein